MKLKSPASAVVLALAITAGGASAQGLLSIDAVTDYWQDVPFNISASASAGWDSNSNAASEDAQDSAYLAASVTAAYGKKGKRSNTSIGVDVGVSHYLDSIEGLEDTTYNSRGFFNYSRAMSPRLTFSNNLYATYEVEPDYEVGVSTSRREDQYIYLFDQMSLSYAWTNRLSTTASYSIGTIIYEDDDLGDRENRLEQGASLQANYRLTRRTSAVGEYRMSWVNYDSLQADSTSYFLLAGLDHAFSPRMSGTLRAGAQFYDSSRTTTAAPYVEAALSYLVDRRTSFRHYHRLGFEGADLGVYDSRYAYRTGLSGTHQFSERLSGNVGAHYSYSLYNLGSDAVELGQSFIDDVDDARDNALRAADAAGVELTDDQLAVFDVAEDELAPTDDLTEHQINLNLGLSYRLFSNVDVNAGYTYTTVSSNEDRDYDRHRLSLGVGASF